MLQGMNRYQYFINQCFTVGLSQNSSRELLSRVVHISVQLSVQCYGIRLSSTLHVTDVLDNLRKDGDIVFSEWVFLLYYERALAEPCLVCRCT